jgi:hypothetical protein
LGEWRLREQASEFGEFRIGQAIVRRHGTHVRAWDFRQDHDCPTE